MALAVGRGTSGAVLSSTALEERAALARPVVLAGDKTLPVVDPLRALFPEGGLRRGTVVSVSADTAGATTLALCLLAAPSAAGEWCAAAGLPELGLLAASQLGVKLERLALVPAIGDRWAVVAGALLDSMGVLVLAPPHRARHGDARRLTARARQRGSVVVIVGEHWPERPDLRLRVEAGAPDAGGGSRPGAPDAGEGSRPGAPDAGGLVGLDAGAGYLRSRRVDVVASGRGAAVRERRVPLWLPGPTGGVESAVAAVTSTVSAVGSPVILTSLRQ